MARIPIPPRSTRVDNSLRRAGTTELPARTVLTFVPPAPPFSTRPGLAVLRLLLCRELGRCHDTDAYVARRVDLIGPRIEEAGRLSAAERVPPCSASRNNAAAAAGVAPCRFLCLPCQWSTASIGGHLSHPPPASSSRVTPLVSGIKNETQKPQNMNKANICIRRSSQGEQLLPALQSAGESLFSSDIEMT